MDIALLEIDGLAEIRPESIIGMLWLQTHFENEYWEALACNQVRIAVEHSKQLSDDAMEAGLTLNYLPSVSIRGKS